MSSGDYDSLDSKVLLSRVRITDAVVQSCFAHAFTTENEEVMGVLLGNITVVEGVPPAAGGGSGSGTNAYALPHSKVGTIWASHIMQRNVRRSDRVEVAPEALSVASDTAEAMTNATGVSTRVIGWYHSHPKMTAIPSKVDLNSQKTYQQLDSGWVGLIFGVFFTDSEKRNDCAIHCFQTGPRGVHVAVPIEVVSTQRLGLPLTIGPSSHAMLAMFNAEVDSAMENLHRRTNNDAGAVEAAHGLRQTQLFLLERLIGEPAVKYLEWCSIPVLEAEVTRLEEELTRLS